MSNLYTSYIGKTLHQDAERHGSLSEHKIFSLGSSMGYFSISIKGNGGK